MELLKTEGTFEAEVLPPVDGSWLHKNKNNKPYILIPLIVIGGACEDQRIRNLKYLTPGAMPYTSKELAECFGWNGDLNGLADGTTSFAGMRVRIVTETDGEYTNVKWMNPAGGSSGEKVTPAEVAAIIEEFNTLSMATAADNQAPGSENPVNESADMPDMADDEIKF